MAQKPKTNNADDKGNSNTEVVNISSNNSKLVDSANHENENSTNNSDDDGNKSDDEYSMSNNELVGEHVDNIRDSGDYDSIDDLIDYYLSIIMIEESPRNSKPSTPTINYPVILSPRDTNDLDYSDMGSSYPVILSAIRASKAGPCHLYLKNLNIRLMKSL